MKKIFIFISHFIEEIEHKLNFICCNIRISYGIETNFVTSK